MSAVLHHRIQHYLGRAVDQDGEVVALHSDGTFAAHWARQGATDVLWTMLSVTNWEQLTAECGWSNQQYVSRMKTIAEWTLVKD
jgi:hypothetical protein